MSRRFRSAIDVCADCGMQDPNWASVNCAVLICDECCSIHRTLGRQVSQIKSLKKSIWFPTELQMVRDLYAAGSNTIFEHSLLDSSNTSFAAAITNTIKSSRKKPGPKDSLHPIKADFIRSKYQNLAFINRSHINDETQEDLSEQLHSSVRTPNLKTSLRLLVSGADPNFLHSEKGNTPLIMATKSGLISQVELLLVYGADPLISDVKGKTPIDYAIAAEHNDIAQRLIQSQYELTDRLSYFLCGRRSDHLSAQHFLVPEMSDSIDVSDLAKEAKQKLQHLPNKLFHEIAKDVYDEVDRREISDIWASLQPLGNTLSNQQSVPFLPVNPHFSATRNQGRQKLARYNAREFATLVIDILTESRRRQFCLNCENESAKSLSKPNSIIHARVDESDEDNDSEPLYDSVASEDDSDNEMNDLSEKNQEKNASGKSLSYKVLERQLLKSDALIQELVSSNKDMHQEITRLQIMVEKLVDENAQLRAVIIPKSESVRSNIVSLSPPPAILPRAPKPLLDRPQSMFERSIPPFQSNKPPRPPPVLPRDDSGIESSYHSHLCNKAIESKADEELQTLAKSVVMPNKSDLFRKTEQITKSIQELLSVALEAKAELFVLCSENIYQVVEQMICLFPEMNEETQEGENRMINALLTNLRNSALKLCSHCKNNSPQNVDNRQLAQEVIQCAYEVAKAAKELVTKFTN